jgi:hypothetical protein
MNGKIAPPIGVLLVLLGVCAMVQARDEKPPKPKKVVPAKVLTMPELIRKSWDFDNIYTKYADADGIPVIAPDAVEDRALSVAAETVCHMVSTREDIRKDLVKAEIRVGIIPRDGGILDLPDNQFLIPDADIWRRARSKSANQDHPLCAIGEENILGLLTDKYRGEGQLVRDFALTIHFVSLVPNAKGHKEQLAALFADAKKKKLWENTIALRTEVDYWGEGVQSYFDAGFPWKGPADGVNNGVNTREKLKLYDPELFKLIDTTFKSVPWRWRLPVAGVTIPAPTPPKLKK